MKKNKVLRLASVLMMACLLTTCVISGTFAKYVSTKSAQDQARVAYWGFKEATLEIKDLFANAYDDSVGSTVDVIAPGTEGSVTIQYKYVGKENIKAPEVAYKFEVSTAGSSCADKIKDNDNITWAFYKKDETPTWGTWIQLCDAIDNKLDEEVQAGALPELSKNEYTIAWKWVFEKDEAGNTADTDMSESLAQVVLIITVTATQID